MSTVTIANTDSGLSGKTLINADDNQNITGQKSFTRSPSAPFVVNASSAKVDNLDADKLDGQHGSYYNDPTNLSGAVAIAKGGTNLTSVGANGTLLQSDGSAMAWTLVPYMAAAAASAQFDKTNTTLADVTGLTVNVLAGKTYVLRAALMTTQDTTGGAKVTFGGTATATTFAAQASVYGHNTTVLTGRGTSLGTSLGSFVPGVAASMVLVEGYLVVNAAGTVTVMFAQASASGTSSVLVGSSLTALRIA